MSDVQRLTTAFAERFGGSPDRIVRAPGRVNLIGEHTDYNDGFVFPVAIDRATYAAIRHRPDRIVQVQSLRFGGSDTFPLDTITHNHEQPWTNYVRGVVKALLAADHPLTGADLLLDGDVPLGAGLSSSASLEIAVGYGFQLLNNLNILGEELALLAQGAENTFVGVQCGIMDQLISTMGQAGHALLIDCRELTSRPVPIPDSTRVIVCESGVHHQLGDSGYNQRRAECNEAVRVLSSVLPQIRALRDVTMADLEQFGHLLSPVVLRRARHVVSENQRVLDSEVALRKGELERFGALMNESHRSMRDDYEISVPEIDRLVEIARQVPGCFGSRLTGGGFGGSTVSLVDANAVDAFAEYVAPAYRQQTGIETKISVCRASDGVSVLSRPE